MNRENLKECKKCGYQWYSKVTLPKECPKCKSYRWSKKWEK